MPDSYSIYEINTRILLSDAGRQWGGRATLDAVPDAFFDELNGKGFDWVWFLGVWQTGGAGRNVSLSNPQWRAEYEHILPGFGDDDVVGSPFAVRTYRLHADFGDAGTLERLRGRLHSRGMKLMLDYVPNHTALDHAWADEHPEYFILGTEADLAREPENYVRRETASGSRIFAYGRDPFFSGWPDTLQVNIRHGGCREARMLELMEVARVCDGLRCDMAMLLLPDVFRRTWGERSRPADGSEPVDAPFWPEAITRVREVNPAFVFMAEVYWDLEWTLLQQGFDFTYDKRLYDRLRGHDTAGVRAHLRAGASFQKRCVRFLENHDEARAAAAFAWEVHRAAAVATFLTPGLRLFHEGQFEGRHMHVSVHLGRRPVEAVDGAVEMFYQRLLGVLRRPEVRNGDWRLLEAVPAWAGNASFEQFVCFRWMGQRRLLAAVNLAGAAGQCYVRLDEGFGGDRAVMLRDLLGQEAYGRDISGGRLYLDLPPWGYNVFEVERSS